MKPAALLCVLLACVLAFAAFPCFALAHGGGLDAQGGHNSPDGYHYHHGYPAHQHENGICPYVGEWNPEASDGTEETPSPDDNTQSVPSSASPEPSSSARPSSTAIAAQTTPVPSFSSSNESAEIPIYTDDTSSPFVYLLCVLIGGAAGAAITWGICRRREAERLRQQAERFAGDIRALRGDNGRK